MRQAVTAALMDFFEQVAKKDTTWLAMLEQEPCFRVEAECWHFKLIDLYAFLRRADPVFHSVDYRQFRQLLYSSPVNQRIKQYGAEVMIVENYGKADQSRYALSWGDCVSELDTNSK